MRAAGEEPCGAHIECEDRVPVVDVERRKRRAAHDSGIGHEGVEAGAALDRVGGKTRAGGRVAQVGVQGDDLHALASEFGAERVEGRSGT